MRQDFLRIRRYLLPAGAAVAGALLLVELRVERASVERANRLHRAGKAEAAVGIYDAALSASRGADLESELRYNLGTSLLRAGQLQEAEVELRRGLGTLDPETAQRGQVNLGYRYLSDALGTLAPDSAVQLLIAAGARTDIEVGHAAVHAPRRHIVTGWCSKTACSSRRQRF